jgi:hypothetical protein
VELLDGWGLRAEMSRAEITELLSRVRESAETTMPAPPVAVRASG